MKTLTLLRHAKSGWDAPVARDFDRPLNARGRKAARAMGREMRRLGLGFDLILASPGGPGHRDADRAGAGLWRRGRHPLRRERLSRFAGDAAGAGARRRRRGWRGCCWSATIRAWSSSPCCCPGPAPLRDEIAAKYPTGALAEIGFDVGALARHRRRAKAGSRASSGRASWPRALARRLGRAARSLIATGAGSRRSGTDRAGSARRSAACSSGRVEP